MEKIKNKLRGKYENRMEIEWSTPGLHSRILSLIPNKKAEALDLGCGTGNLSLQLKSKGYNVIGADIENFIRFPGILFKKVDLNKNFPFKKDKFDLITATEIIEHLENPRHFIREIKRVLKKGGLGIISTPNVLCWKARIYYLIRGIIWGFRKQDYRISGHITPVTRYDFERMCEEEEIKITKITYNNGNREFFGDNLIIVIEK